MKIIKTLAKKIEEELRDAEEYAKLSYTTQTEYPDVSDVFLTLSRQEVTHANMLHAQVERLIKAYDGDVPPAMMGVWEWEHEKMIDNLARIKILQDAIR